MSRYSLIQQKFTDHMLRFHGDVCRCSWTLARLPDSADCRPPVPPRSGTAGALGNTPLRDTATAWRTRMTSLPVRATTSTELSGKHRNLLSFRLFLPVLNLFALTLHLSWFISLFISSDYMPLSFRRRSSECHLCPNEM